MAFTPKTWELNDTIMPEDANNWENGIYNALEEIENYNVLKGFSLNFTDANNISNLGSYFIDLSAGGYVSNMPKPNFVGVLLHLGYQDNGYCQLAFSQSNERTYFRYFIDGEWLEWLEFFAFEDLTVALSNKADKESPTFTGVPTAPTAPTTTSNTQLANTLFVHNAIDAAQRSYLKVRSAGTLAPTTSGVIAVAFSVSMEQIGSKFQLATHSTYGSVWRNVSGSAITAMLQFIPTFSSLAPITGAGRNIDIKCGTSLTSTTVSSYLMAQGVTDLQSGYDEWAPIVIARIPANGWLYAEMFVNSQDRINGASTTLTIAEL